MDFSAHAMDRIRERFPGRADRIIDAMMYDEHPKAAGDGCVAYTWCGVRVVVSEEGEVVTAHKVQTVKRLAKRRRQQRHRRWM
jgi:hypothetical protein